MKKITIVSVLTFLLGSINLVVGQHDQTYLIKGAVYNSVNQKPIAFAHIIWGQEKKGTISNEQGKYCISSKEKVKHLIVSCMGYQKKHINMNTSVGVTNIMLSPESYTLAEVNIVPQENPALRIIKEAITHKRHNDYENFPLWEYLQYEKELTFDQEKPAKNRDRPSEHSFGQRSYLRPVQERSIQIDWNGKHHISSEIIAVHQGDLENPFYTTILPALSIYNIYRDPIYVGRGAIESPLTTKGIKHYAYQLKEAKTGADGDTTFLILFQSHKFFGGEKVKGKIYLNASLWQPKEIEISYPGRDLNLNIQSKNSMLLRYSSYQDTLLFPVYRLRQAIIQHGKQDTIPFIGRSELKVSQLNLKASKNKQSLHIAKKETLAIIERDERYWDSLRPFVLNKIEKENLNYFEDAKKIKKLGENQASFFQLYIKKNPLKLTERGKQEHMNKLEERQAFQLASFINLSRAFAYNQYEGLRFQLGLKEDALFSYPLLSAYMAYGFKDKGFKVGGRLKFPMSIHSKVDAFIIAKSDVEKTGSLDFFPKIGSSFQLYDANAFYVNRMNKVQLFHLGINRQLWNHFNVGVSCFHKHQQIDEGLFAKSISIDKFPNQYQTAGLAIQLRISPFEKFEQKQHYLKSMGTSFPLITIQYIKGVKHKGFGDLDFDRLDLGLKGYINIGHQQQLSFNMVAGYLTGDLSPSMIYSMNSAYGQWGVFADKSFNSMHLNEFYATAYAGIFMKYSFGKRLFSWGKLLNPQLSLIHNMGIGQLDQTSSKRYPYMKDFQTGYFESGIALNKLIGPLGFTVVYRYGSYGYDDVSKNLNYKLTFKLVGR